MSAPHEDAQTATGATPDTEAPAGAEGGREDLRALRDRVDKAIRGPLLIGLDEPCGPDRAGQWADHLVKWVMAVVQPELDRLTERIPYREGETEEDYLYRQVARWRSETYQARRMATATKKRAETAEAERDQLDIRIDEITTTYQRVNGLHQIGPEGNHCTTCRRTYPCPTVKALDNIDDQASAVIAERDQLNAAVAKVRALAQAAERIECGAGWTFDPAAVLAALDQPASPT